MSELSDELLVAYVDGQLALDQSIAVKRVIDFDNVASERVVGLGRANKRLEEAFAAMLQEKPPEAPDAPPEGDASADEPVGRGGALAAFLGEHGGLVVIAASLALVLLGATTGYLLTRGLGGSAPEVATSPAVPPWQQEIAQAQALLGRDALEVSLESQANIELVRFQMANAIGETIVIPDLEAEGLAFVRAQILRRSGEAIAQISYLPGQGRPIVLYAKANDGGPVQTGTHEAAGMRSLTWVYDGIIYVLTASLNEADMTKLASTVKQKIIAP